MKIKKLFGAAILTAAAVICCTQATFAAEKTIFEETMNNVYSSNSLDVNWWGNLSQKDTYVKGEQWASPWGSEGWYSDAEDGSLAIHAKVGLEASGQENSIAKKVIADPLPQDSTVEFTVDLKTGDKPTESITEVWFGFEFENRSSKNMFMLLNSPTGEPKVGFASTTTWPFTAKDFDRNPNNLKMDYGKDYTLKMTIKPTITKNCKFIAELYDGDGNKIAAGLIEEWTGVTADTIKNITGISFSSRSGMEAGKTEPALYIKRVSVKGIYEDQKPEAELAPADGSTSVALDTPCYMQFESAVKDIDVSDISVSGGATVDGVEMQDGGKRALIKLSGLKGNTTYTINVENVSDINSESAFGYSWSFTTGSAATLGTPYFGLKEQRLTQSMSDMDLNQVVQTDSDAYTSGDAWAMSDSSDFSTCYRVSDDGYLWARARLNHGQGDISILSHKFEPIKSGETLDVNLTVKLTDYASDQTEASIRIGDGSANNYTVLRFNHLWNGLELSALSQNQIGGAWVDENGTGTVLLSRGWWHINEENIGLDGDILLNLSVVPDDSGYLMKVTVKGTKEYTASKHITEEEALALSTIEIYTSTNGGSVEADFLAIKDIEIAKVVGNTKPIEGDNRFYINWENLDSSSPFNADILIVERDGSDGYGTVKNVTVIRNEDISGENGILECPFSITDGTSVIDVFVMDNTDSGNLLSDKTSFNVAD